MPVYEVVEAHAYDCGQMARKLRSAHDAALYRMGIKAHRELRHCFDQSAFRKAWRIDGKLVGLGGITGSHVAATGVVWLAFTEEAKLHKYALVRTARAELEAAMKLKHSLSTIILLRDEASFRFAHYLGFVLSKDWNGHFDTVLMTYKAAEPVRN